MANALTIFSGTSDEAKKAKVELERAGANARIAELERDRPTALLGDGGIEAVRAIDRQLEEQRRTITICNERLALIDADIRRRARERREEQRRASIKVIAAELAKRHDWATEMEAAIKRVVELHDLIADARALRGKWPFGLPEHFSLSPTYDFGRDVLRRLRDVGYHMVPGAVNAALGVETSGGTGETHAPRVGPPSPRDLPGRVAAKSKLILDSLKTLDIHPAEPEADEEAA